MLLLRIRERWSKHLETKKHKHSSDEKDISHQSGNEIIHNSNVDKSSHVRDIDPDLQDVEGIGPTTAKKLKEAGINSVMELAVTTVEQRCRY